MELIEQFKNYLNTQKKQVSKATVKNYIADIKKFVRWHEETFKKVFDPSMVTHQIIELYKQQKTSTARGVASQHLGGDRLALSEAEGMGSPEVESADKQISPRSVERYMSSLRKFFHFLKLEGIASNDPFELDAKRSTLEPDPYHLRDFKNHLYVYNAANLTIKNYIIDVKQFLNWTEQVTGADKAWHVKDKNIFDKIDALLIEEYKNRLSDSGICATSINRKLSSLRRYLKWAESDGLIKKPAVILANQSQAWRRPE